MPALSWWLMRRQQYQPFVGLPNILAGKFVVPELLQEDATPQNLAQALLNLVGHKETVAELETIFTNIHNTLRQDTADKAAQVIERYLT
ncbi:MAG: lipid-A-disaccharide synthase, partial [Gallionellaceae bacterium]|nr:lipid-A-disaccharide synthase [Gallionellaceae bacterium]